MGMRLGGRTRLVVDFDGDKRLARYVGIASRNLGVTVSDRGSCANACDAMMQDSAAKAAGNRFFIFMDVLLSMA